VLGWQRRQGRLQLTLVLADGSKSLIPGEWTDLESPAEPPSPVALGSVATCCTPARCWRRCCVASTAPMVFQAVMMRASRARRWRVQLRLDLVETPAPPPAVWDALTGEQQAAVVALLARLIAKMLTFPPQHQAEEAEDAR
jgi:hypothetical protein